MEITTASGRTSIARRSHRSHRSRRIAGIGAALVAAAGVVLGGASSAQASYEDGQAYWANDWCSYSVVNGAWTGNSCIRTYTDAIGAVYPKVYSLYTWDASTASHLGALTFQMDDRDPSYVLFRDPSSTVFEGGRWARQARGDGTAPIEIQVWDGVANAWTWSVLQPATSASTTTSATSALGTTTIGGATQPNGFTIGGPTDNPGYTTIGGGGASSLTGIPAIDILTINHNNNLAKTWLAPACNSSYNGCA